MKQVLIRRGTPFVAEVPAPLLDDDGVLVEVAYSVISSGTEISGVKTASESLMKKAMKHPDKVLKVLHYLKSQGVQKTLAIVKGATESAFALGYSCSGTVVQVGKNVTGVSVGDDVACAGAGLANHAELVLVPRNLVVNVPEGCDVRSAASATLGAIALQGVRLAGVQVGETVAVIGLGLIGQLATQELGAAGCRTIGFDLDPSRVELAKRLGLDQGFVAETDSVRTVEDLTEGYGADCTIITAASRSNTILQQAVEMTRKKGKVVIVGDVGLGINRSPFYEKELMLLISCSYGPGRYDPRYEEQGIDYPYAYVRWTENRNMQAYLQLIASGKLNFDALVSKVYPLGQAALAYQALQGTERQLCAMLDYGTKENVAADCTPVTVIRFNSLPKKQGQLNVGVIGAGGFVKSVHLPNMQKLSQHYKIAAVAGQTGVNARETARLYGAGYCTTDYRRMLQDDNIDVVLIGTRHNLHAPIAVEAAQAGKAIFVEKPMAITSEELKTLTGVLRQTKVPFMVGYNRRFSPVARALKCLIQDRVNPLIAHYRVNAGHIPLEHWVHTAEGGGRVIGEACHMFDLFNFLVGEHVGVQQVEVEAISPRTKHISKHDNFTVALKFADGSLCSLLYTALGPKGLSKEYLEVFWDQKGAFVDDFQALKVYDKKSKKPHQVWSGAQDKGHLQELEIFAQFLKGKRDAPISLETMCQAARTSLVVRALLESS